MLIRECTFEGYEFQYVIEFRQCNVELSIFIINRDGKSDVSDGATFPLDITLFQFENNLRDMMRALIAV
jgi:hypothetical protein